MAPFRPKHRPTAGKYRDRVTIEQPSEDAGDVDDFGEIDLSDDANWSTYATRWAEVIPTSGREFVSGEQVQSDVTHMVHFRHDSLTVAITPKMRIAHGSKNLNVVTAYEKGNSNSEVVVQCREQLTP